MLTCHLVQVGKQLEVIEVLRDTTRIHLFFENTCSMVRRIETVVEVHDPHQLVFGFQQAAKIHRLLNFECLALFVVGKIVAGNGIPVFPLSRVTLDKNFKHFSEFRLLACLVVEIEQQVINFLLVVRAIFSAHFLSPTNGFLVIIGALVEHGQLPLLCAVGLAARLLPLGHVIKRFAKIFFLKIDLGNIVVSLSCVSRWDITLVERGEKILNSASAIAIFDFDIGRQFDDCAFFIAVQLG